MASQPPRSAGVDPRSASPNVPTAGEFPTSAATAATATATATATTATTATAATAATAGVATADGAAMDAVAAPAGADAVTVVRHAYIQLLLALVLGMASGLPLAAGEASVDDERYLVFLREGALTEAARVAQANVAERPGDARWWAYLGAAQSLLEEHRHAADAFCRAECLGGPAALDRKMLFLRVQALAEVRANTRADAVLRQLSQRYPFSRLAGRDEALSQLIRKRLGEGVTAAHLNWYRKASVQASQAGLPGLAIEYGEEFLTLAAVGGSSAEADDPEIRLALGSEYLQLGAFTRARDHFLRVPPDHHGWRAAIFQALALRACGDEAGARGRLFQAVAGAANAEVRAQALRLLPVKEDG